MKEKRILHLTLHRKWFDEIASGEKTEEYRERNWYWKSRLYTNDGSPKVFDEIHFRNGYSLDRPFMITEWKGTRAETDYIIDIGHILGIKNWSGVLTHLEKEAG